MTAVTPGACLNGPHPCRCRNALSAVEASEAYPRRTPTSGGSDRRDSGRDNCAAGRKSSSSLPALP